MIGRTFVPQSFPGNQKGPLGKNFQSTAGPSRDDFPDSVSDQKIQKLGSGGSSHGRLTKTDLHPLVGRDVDRETFCGADKGIGQFRPGFPGIFIDVLPQKGKDAFFRKLKIQPLVIGIDYRTGVVIEFQNRDFIFLNAHGTSLHSGFSCHYTGFFEKGKRFFRIFQGKKGNALG